MYLLSRIMIKYPLWCSVLCNGWILWHSEFSKNLQLQVCVQFTLCVSFINYKTVEFSLPTSLSLQCDTVANSHETLQVQSFVLGAVWSASWCFGSSGDEAAVRRHQDSFQDFGLAPCWVGHSESPGYIHGPLNSRLCLYKLGPDIYVWL